jgi:hypothetical protein
MIKALDLDGLRDRYRNATPFPHVVIDDFLEPAFVREVSGSYPTFDQALAQGFAFNFVNEQRKVQITQPAKFSEPVRRLNDALASSKFLSDLEYVTGIPRLLADDKLNGGGMHITGSGGRLDVHVDFNRLEDQKLFRRLNILVYLNPEWRDDWGGQIELWDANVKVCHLSALPVMNRCLIFETSNISYHGVRPITAPAEVARRSFAAYYYTAEAPSGWDGKSHSTIFRARPDEKFRGLVAMPAEKLKRNIQKGIQQTKNIVKTLIGKS